MILSLRRDFAVAEINKISLSCQFIRETHWSVTLIQQSYSNFLHEGDDIQFSLGKKKKGVLPGILFDALQEICLQLFISW